MSNVSYAQAMGILTYASTMTRLDFAYAVGKII
jgi:hypothetical protein